MLNQDLFAALAMGRLIRSDMKYVHHQQRFDFWGDAPPTTLRNRPVRGIKSSEDGPQKWVDFKYAVPDPSWSHSRADLVVTPSGVSWTGAIVDLDSSSPPPESLKRFLPGLNRFNPERIAEATVVQAEYSGTYGDWVTCYLRPIVLADRLVEPLLLPPILKTRDYVAVDLARLGIAHRFCDRPIKVAKCLVLRRRTTSLVWTSDEARDFRDRMRIRPDPPEPGSLIYLSRVGVKSNSDLSPSVRRETRSELIERTIREMGGTVVRTEGLLFDDFARYASRAETVVADHGAALYNLLQWNTRNVVEIAAEDWWLCCFLSLSTALGVERHTIIRAGLYDDAALVERLQAACLQNAALRAP